MSFRLSTTAIEPDALRKTLFSQAAGAYVSFEGWVRSRNEGRAVTALEYEAYGALAQTEAEAILTEARTKFGILEVACVHRVGTLSIGELAVWIGVISEHRGQGFEACRYVIDELKARVPIWKKEHYAEGASHWINAASRGPHAPGPLGKNP